MVSAHTFSVDKMVGHDAAKSVLAVVDMSSSMHSQYPRLIPMINYLTAIAKVRRQVVAVVLPSNASHTRSGLSSSAMLCTLWMQTTTL